MNLDELQTELTAAKTENATLKGQVTAAEADASTAKASLATATSTITTLTTEKATLQTQVDDLTTKLTVANNGTATLQTAFDAHKAGEPARIEQAVTAKLPAAVEEKLKTALPAAAAAAGFRIPAPVVDRKDDPNDKRTPREKLEAAVAKQLETI